MRDQTTPHATLQISIITIVPPSRSQPLASIGVGIVAAIANVKPPSAASPQNPGVRTLAVRISISDCISTVVLLALGFTRASM
jgi:hypothetical protein